MTDKEKILIADLLDMAAEEFGNHGCNDIDPELLAGWSKDELQKATKEFLEYNGDPENYDIEITIEHYGDFCLMGYMADKIRQEAKNV